MCVFIPIYLHLMKDFFKAPVHFIYLKFQGNVTIFCHSNFCKNHLTSFVFVVIQLNINLKLCLFLFDRDR